MTRRLLPALCLLLTRSLFAQQWPQWARNLQHATNVAAVGQHLDQNLVNLVYDPLVPQEINQNQGELLSHYQAPLIDDNDVYMMFKSGFYSSGDYSTQTWGETRYSWQSGSLRTIWQFVSDWKALGNSGDFFEPVFHPALANGALYVPGAGGSVFKVSKATGTATRINPFGTLDPNTYTTSPLTVDPAGNVFFNVIQLATFSDFYQADVIASWLVRVAPDDTVQRVSYASLTAGAPRGTDLCLAMFSDLELPWPPSPNAVPPSFTCGSQRPGMNIAPAAAADGTIYTVSRAHFNSRWSYLIAINPDLTRKWMVSLRNRFNDGCGVTPAQGGSLPPNGAVGGCRAGAPTGVDPATNTPGGGRVEDNASSSPVVAPDGSIFYGTYTRYNYAQGHLMHFAADGTYLGGYNFGWDITPGVYPHDGTYSVITKENHYGDIGSYCGDSIVCSSDRNGTNPAYPEGYFVTQLNSDMKVEWSFRSTNTESCDRDANGRVACVSDHPFGFEWCVNAFVVDANGVLYANSEDGWLYAINQGGTLRQRIFQQLALGAAYTPTSIDSAGRIYSQNAGHLFVAGGKRPSSRGFAHPVERSSRETVPR